MKRQYSHGYSISISPKAFARLTADLIHTERGHIRKGHGRWDDAINAALDAEGFPRPPRRRFLTK
jgi:hypothetical protein